jgi:hypothetical protein
MYKLSFAPLALVVILLGGCEGSGATATDEEFGPYPAIAVACFGNYFGYFGNAAVGTLTPQCDEVASSHEPCKVLGRLRITQCPYPSMGMQAPNQDVTVRVHGYYGKTEDGRFAADLEVDKVIGGALGPHILEDFYFEFASTNEAAFELMASGPSTVPFTSVGSPSRIGSSMTGCFPVNPDQAVVDIWHRCK